MNFFTFGRSEASVTVVITIASCLLVVAVWMLGGRASIILYPGFYLLRSVSGHQALFDPVFILLGLILNASLFAGASVTVRRILISKN